MLTTVDKAVAGAIVAFLANEAVAYAHVTIPMDIQTAATALLTGIMVWLIPNKAGA